MKAILAALVLGFFLVHSCGQITLNSGDSWTHQFTNLTDRGLIFPPSIPPNSGYNVAIDPATFDGSDVLKLEMVGIKVQTNTFAAGNPSGINVIFGWQRFGALRITMLAGSLRITNVEIHAIVEEFGPEGMQRRYYADRVVPQPPPRLDISRTSNSVQLSWWTNLATGYVLESTNRVPSLSWVPVTQSPTVITGRAHLTLPATGAAEYFRLRK